MKKILYLVLSIMIFNQVSIYSTEIYDPQFCTTSKIAFNTDAEAIEAGWDINPNNKYYESDELVIVKKWVSDTELKWVFAKTLGYKGGPMVENRNLWAAYTAFPMVSPYDWGCFLYLGRKK